jgi:hypothetical protein
VLALGRGDAVKDHRRAPDPGPDHEVLTDGLPNCPAPAIAGAATATAPAASTPPATRAVASRVFLFMASFSFASITFTIARPNENAVAPACRTYGEKTHHVVAELPQRCCSTGCGVTGWHAGSPVVRTT